MRVWKHNIDQHPEVRCARVLATLLKRGLQDLLSALHKGRIHCVLMMCLIHHVHLGALTPGPNRLQISNEYTTSRVSRSRDRYPPPVADAYTTDASLCPYSCGRLLQEFRDFTQIEGRVYVQCFSNGHQVLSTCTWPIATRCVP